MPRKPKEVEQEIDVNEKKKPETYVTRWFKEHCVDNVREIKIISDLTARSAEEQFSLYIRSGNNEVFAVIFYATMMTILEFLKSKEKSYNELTIEICNSINIGYCNNDSEDNEKVGNFMPILEYIGINRNIVNDGSVLDADKTKQNYIRWKELNIKKNVEYYKEIQEKAYERLKTEFKTNLRTSEAVIPLFCIFMDHISNVLKMKFKEAEGTDVSEVFMEVLGLFKIFYSYDEEEDQEIIEFEPNITMKLALKEDGIASRE